jgi:hypothetical protein
MQKLRFIGLDVHKESIAIAVADGDGSTPEDVAIIPNDITLLLKPEEARVSAVGREARLVTLDARCERAYPFQIECRPCPPRGSPI